MATERGTVCGMPGARTPEDAYRMYDEQYWKPEPLPVRRPYWRRWWYTMITAVTFVVFVIAMIMFFLWCAVDTGHGAEITTTLKRNQHAPVLESIDLNRFGTYSDEYYARRWKRMCNGPARYDAMREANDRGRSMPCGR